MVHSRIDILIDKALKEFNVNNQAIISWDMATMLNQLGLIESPDSMTPSTAACILTYKGIKIKEQGYLNYLEEQTKKASEPKVFPASPINQSISEPKPQKERDWFFQIALILISLTLGTIVAIILIKNGIK